MSDDMNTSDEKQAARNAQAAQAAQAAQPAETAQTAQTAEPAPTAQTAQTSRLDELFSAETDDTTVPVAAPGPAAPTTAAAPGAAPTGAAPTGAAPTAVLPEAEPAWLRGTDRPVRTTPRVRWAGIVWGLVFAATGWFAVWTLLAHERRAAFSGWILSLDGGGWAIVGALALGALLLVIGLTQGLKAATRGRRSPE
jgi:hypothetical protein